MAERAGPGAAMRRGDLRRRPLQHRGFHHQRSRIVRAYERRTARGITGAMRIAHLADAFRLRAEVHGMGNYSQHLCMAIPNTTYYESLVMSTEVGREAVVD